MSELLFPGNLAAGVHGKGVRRVQEWLSLHDFRVSIDGDFGPATTAAVSAFQAGVGRRATGAVDAATWEELVAPLATADAASPASRPNLGAVVVSIARAHLKQSPREVGGQNMGPWVRYYMRGEEGLNWPWCAGFVSTVLKQAAACVGTSVPVGYTVSCDTLAAFARAKKLFVPQKDANARTITAGSLFLSRRTSTDWVHTGIVVQASADTFTTIEGNTNDSGDSEGYEVCARTRAYDAKDFVVI